MSPRDQPDLWIDLIKRAEFPRSNYLKFSYSSFPISWEIKNAGRFLRSGLQLNRYLVNNLPFDDFISYYDLVERFEEEIKEFIKWE